MTKERKPWKEYKLGQASGVMLRFGKDKPKVIVTEEDKRIRSMLWKAEIQLNNILGKLKMGFEVTKLEKKRVPFLKARIEHLKKKLFNSSPSRTQSSRKGVIKKYDE